MNNQHLPFMKLALLQAQKAYEKDEIPVGAIVVKEGKVIGRGYNQREMLNDPTAHARKYRRFCRRNKEESSSLS